jgi:pyridoxal phosphate enzyme (YggS family)
MPVEPAALSPRLDALLGRIDKAAAKSGRSLSDITLVAVTKTVPPPLIREAARLGLKDFGENRVQEAADKRPALDGLAARWHMIGHLQSNKARKAAELFDAVQSLDGGRLAGLLNGAAEAADKTLPCLVEVKTSPEPAKHGLPPEELERFLEERERWPRLRIEGLMTVAPYSGDAEKARPFFARLRELGERHRAALGGNPRLSMGMSHDFEAAILEGATMIRIGTALFGDRP